MSSLFGFDNSSFFNLNISLHLAIEVFRRAPDSFTDQQYYTWMAYEYKAKDGVPRYAKFRLVPADDRAETGLLTEEEQRKPWYDSLSPSVACFDLHLYPIAL